MSEARYSRWKLVLFNPVIHCALGRQWPCRQWSTSALIHHCGTWTREVAGSVFSGGCSRWFGQHLSFCCGSLTMCSCLTYKCLFLNNPDVVFLGKAFEAKNITGMWLVRLCETQQALHMHSPHILTSSVLKRVNKHRLFPLKRTTSMNCLLNFYLIMQIF